VGDAEAGLLQQALGLRDRIHEVTWTQQLRSADEVLMAKAERVEESKK
jgi:hypothetical protein